MGPLFSHPLWVRSFLARCGSALFYSSSLWCSSELLGLLDVLVCPSRRARRFLSWRTVRLCTACALTCCASSAGLTSFLARRRPAQVISLGVDASMLLLFCYGLWVAIPPMLLEQRSTLLLTCNHRCVGRVPRGQYARLDSDTLVLIDRSACLVEPCACDRHIKRTSWSAHGCLGEPHRGSLSLSLFLSSRLAVLAPVRFWV